MQHLEGSGTPVLYIITGGNNYLFSVWAKLFSRM